MRSTPRLLIAIDILSAIFLLIASMMVFVYAPVEAVMGPVQKVFYFHVATAWLGMLAFGAGLVAAIAYLVTKKASWDQVELSAIEIGLVFLLITIISGSIWARPIWNTWWTWDPRLTTAAIMELAYFAYFMLRSAIEEPERRARFGAVYAIIAFISVPLTFFSIRLFRTIHPVVMGTNEPGAEGNFNMTPEMMQTFLFSLLTFSVLFISFLWHRIRLSRLAEKVEQIKMKLE
jgi:heme exporter protein C